MLCKIILKLIGWRVVGDFKPEIKKKLLAAGPHTSNWDFPLGLLVRCSIKQKIQYVGKASLFKPPLGWLIKRMGGIPVERSKSNNFVNAVVNEYNEREKLAILLAPEGTRKKVTKFKTGFYHIARLAKIPILPAVLDFEVKEFRFLPLFWPTDDIEKDLAELENLFKGIKGFHAKNSFHYDPS